VLLVAAIALIAGCGGDSGSGVARADDEGGATTGATTSTTRAAADAEQAQLDFARCMRDQGLDFPDPTADADGNLRFQPPSGDIDQDAFREGAEACQEYLPAGGELLDPDDPEVQDAQLEFAQCMRDEGIDVPDPQAGQEPGPGSVEIDMDDPAVQAALEECGEIIQRGLGDGGTNP
jgi:hypothetical protein